MHTLFYLKVLQSYRSLTLCPGESSRYADTLMFTRATSNFHGKNGLEKFLLKWNVKGRKKRHHIANCACFLDAV